MNHNKDFKRLIANPHLLASGKNKKHNKIISSHDKLKIFLNDSYKNIYFSDKIILDIHNLLNQKINDIIINQIITEILDNLIEKVIDENKFDFIIPFN